MLTHLAIPRTQTQVHSGPRQQCQLVHFVILKQINKIQYMKQTFCVAFAALMSQNVWLVGCH